MVDFLERRYISQYARDVLGLEIQESGEPANADADVRLTFIREPDRDNPDPEVIFDKVATPVEEGRYEVTLTANEASKPGNYTLVWGYSFDAVEQEYRTFAMIGAASPEYDNLSIGMKNLVDNVWVRFADLFDSPNGGPHLQTYFQSHYGRNRIAQLLRIALGQLNTRAQPYSTYSLEDGQGGGSFPIDQWGPLLEQACVDPETRVLKADLTWVPAQSLKPGDRLVAFDEDLSGTCLRTAEVEFNEIQIKPRVAVETPKQTLYVTPDHKFVVRRKSSEKDGKIWYRRYWVEAQKLVPGRDEILSIGEPWEQQNDFRHGYLSGIFDGEGCLSRKEGWGYRLQVSQKPGLVLSQIEEHLTALGFKFSSHLKQDSGVVNLYVAGGRIATMRVLGTLRPIRLMSKYPLEEIWEGLSLRQIGHDQMPSVPVLSVTPSLDGPVSVMQTSTGTFIAEGLLSHNCYIECIKHLRRSYVEQPAFMGSGAVSRLDRRDYMDRWGSILQDEMGTFTSQIETFKISHMMMGRPKVLVSGGVYGRYGPTRVAGSIAARPRYWTRFM